MRLWEGRPLAVEDKTQMYKSFRKIHCSPLQSLAAQQAPLGFSIMHTANVEETTSTVISCWVSSNEAIAAADQQKYLSGANLPQAVVGFLESGSVSVARECGAI